MHSLARTTAKTGSPLARAVSSRVQAQQPFPTPLLLQPSRAVVLQQNHARHAATQSATLSTLSRSSRRTNSHMWNSQSPSTPRLQWKNRFHTSAPTSNSVTTVKELEQLLAKEDYAEFQQACIALQSTPAQANASKDVYHFLLKTLADSPKAFAPLATEGTTVADTTLDPLNSAIGILTAMSREASSLGNTSMQPDRETLIHLLKVAGFSHKSLSGQKDLWVLVDAIRHGRLPAIMSLDQWELPDLNVELDQDIWKAMFECVGKRDPESGYRTELDTISFLMANQLTKATDVQIDEKLWSYVVQAFGNAGASASLSDIYSRLPTAGIQNPEYSSILAEALAKCGWTQRAEKIITTISAGPNGLPSISPLVTLGQQLVKVGDYETILRQIRLWQDKGQRSDSNKSGFVELNRSLLAANVVALERLRGDISKIEKDRRSDILPDGVLPGIMTPTRLSREQYKEALYIWDKTKDAIANIPESELTAEDYDRMVKITGELNLLSPSQWPIDEYAGKIVRNMKEQGQRPLKSTYYTLMTTIARTREFGPKREDGTVAGKVLKVYEDMVSEDEGYRAKNPQDFAPLVEACFGLYSHSPFTASHWIYSNQEYPVAREALYKVEDMMRRTLGSSTNDHGHAEQVQSYHDSITMANVLVGLAHGDRIDQVWNRWNDLVLQGVERDATLYQALIGASQGQQHLARGILGTVRYEMAKEQPPVPVSAEIFEGLLNCCVRTQDPISARSLIQQYSTSGDIQRTSQWYVPMVKACLSIEGLEHEGHQLLETMKSQGMMAELEPSNGLHEFLMEYFVTKQKNFAAARDIFKAVVDSNEKKLQENISTREALEQLANLEQPLSSEADFEEVKRISNKQLRANWDQIQRAKESGAHLVERLELSPSTASMLNLLVMADLRERLELIEMEKQTGFGGGARARLLDAQKVIHYLAGKNNNGNAYGSIENPIPATSSSSSSTSPSSSSITSKPEARNGGPATGSLSYINKYILGEYIDTCLREGSAEMLEEADWALNSVLPRVIGQKNMAAEAGRLRQALESARSRQQPSLQHQEQQL
ncbi:hypothetical protein EMPS_06850 [Entomortierella parvispora]|uniref:Uncharacterized protein n=1 Tax=Entomortierella parvispora TaxID=205924 RepID=A0A9P3HDR9_9FUNG|nr:hypothetical protein EMPS_06850 [Entomortierella parvispora]